MSTIDQELLNELTLAEGYRDSIDMLQEAMLDSIVPAICTECHATTNSEPDARENYCDSCNSNSVKSCLVLAGVI